MAGSATVAGFVVLTVACSAAQGSAQTPPVLVGVRLVNVAAVDRATIENAKELAAGVFAEGGVQLVWAGGRSSVRAPGLWVTVAVTGYRSVNTPSFSGDLGVTPMPAVRHGLIAYVLWDRIASVARREGLPASIVLGSMIAHEVGHLLGNDSHSPEGVMRAEWRARDFLAVKDGQSGFSREESETMRDQIAREPFQSAAR